MLGLEKPRKPQKAVGEGREGHPEGFPCGLESSTHSPGSGQRDLGPGWDVPLSLHCLGCGLQGGREGEIESRTESPHLLHISPVLKLGQVGCLGRALASFWGPLGEELHTQDTQAPMLSPKCHQVSTGHPAGQGRQRNLLRVFMAADVPGTLLTPMVPGQELTGPAAPCSRAEERGALEGTAFVQQPDLLLSPMPKLVEQDEGPPGACTPYVCACRSPGQDAWAQGLQLLKSSEVRGCHSHSLVMLQGCQGLPP